MKKSQPVATIAGVLIISMMVLGFFQGWFESIENQPQNHSTVQAEPALASESKPEKLLSPQPSDSSTLPEIQPKPGQLTVELTEQPPAVQPPMVVLPELTTVAVRQDYYNSLLQQQPITLWQQWIALLEAADKNHQMAWMLIGYALPYQLQTHQNQELVYQQMADIVSHSSLKASEQTIQILGWTATVPALQILLDETLRHSPDSEMRLKLLYAIEQLADIRWDNRFHPELSPLLETAWQQVQYTEDMPLLLTISVAIAKIGTPEGVELLFNSMTNSEVDIQEQPPQVIAALKAIREVRNPVLVPLLANNLTAYQPDKPIFRLSGEALATMGNLQATKHLFNWATEAPEPMAALTNDWFSLLKDTQSWNWIVTQLEENPSFLSQQVKQAVINGIENSR